MLGKKVKDKVSGFAGIATSVTTYLNGCVRVVIQPKVDKDGKKVEAEVFDVEQVEIVGDGPVAAKIAPNPMNPKPRSGGDRPGVADRKVPSRR